MTPVRDILAWLPCRDRWVSAALGLAIGVLAGAILGWSHAVPVAGLAVLCAAIARIDGAHFIIPDLLVLPLALLGLLDAAVSGVPVLPRVMAMLVLGGVLLGLRAGVSVWTARTALGLGDVKLICAAAAWLPFDVLPPFIFLSALSGLVEVVLRPALPGLTAVDPVAFGRHLAPWLCLCVLAGPWIVAALGGRN